MKVLKTFVQDSSTAVKKVSDMTNEDAFYKHVQGIPIDVWIVNHNLNKYPSITVIDTAGTEYEADIRHIDMNTTELIFCVAFSGTATFN
jgi:hypothetical protein